MKLHLLFAFALLSLSACTKKPDPVTEVTPTPARPAIAAELIEGKGFQNTSDSELPFKLFQIQSLSPKNIQLSPYSLMQVKKMLEIDHKHHDERLEGTPVSSANSFWVKSTDSVLAGYQTYLQENFSAKVGTLNLDEMNQWVSKATQGKITQLFSELPSRAQLIAINTLYFKGKWQFPFEKSQTKLALFQPSPYHSMKTPTMTQTEKLNYLEEKDSLWVALPYQDTSIEMLIGISKKKFDYAALESKLSYEWIQSIASRMSPTKVELQMPRFQFSTQQSLSRLLKETQSDGFLSSVDYSQIFTKKLAMRFQKSRSAVELIQATAIQVNEIGTEAASATAAIEESASVMMGFSKKVHLNHPFFFMIRDRATGQVFFMGRLFEP